MALGRPRLPWRRADWSRHPCALEHLLQVHPHGAALGAGQRVWGQPRGAGWEPEQRTLPASPLLTRHVVTVWTEAAKCLELSECRAGRDQRC